MPARPDHSPGRPVRGARPDSPSTNADYRSALSYADQLARFTVAPAATPDSPAGRVPVESSNLVSVGYEPDRRRLVVEFKGGRVYEYANVPGRVYEGLMRAERHGTYFYHEIKEGPYPFKRLR